MSCIREMMNGTAMLAEGIGDAKKTGSGWWKVKAYNGKPFYSRRFGARPNEMTNVVACATKKQALGVLLDLIKQAQDAQEKGE